MNAEHDRRPARGNGLRIGLVLLTATALGGGFWALFLLRLSYDDFPFPGRDWVSALGPYNEHLVRDYGATNLALGGLLLFAAVLLERRLVQGALVAWLVYARLSHFVFHLAQLHHFSLGYNLAQPGLLGIVVLLPLAL
jgi:hypothetical protein